MIPRESRLLEAQALERVVRELAAGLAKNTPARNYIGLLPGSIIYQMNLLVPSSQPAGELVSSAITVSHSPFRKHIAGLVRVTFHHAGLEPRPPTFHPSQLVVIPFSTPNTNYRTFSNDSLAIAAWAA